jgi:two-component system chemotaxis response regulator CheY
MTTNIDQALLYLKLRALIIDDNEHMRALLRKLLQRMFIESTECQDGSESLATVTMDKPNLILTDYSMAPMDGITFVGKLRRLEDKQIRKTPVIMVTGHANRECIASARDSGVNEILVKPVTEGGLQSRIREVVFRPRVWVDSPTYNGPCRRRRQDPNYKGSERRARDSESVLI